MPEAAVEELFKVELLVLAVLVVVAMVELLDKIAQVVLELLIPVVEAVVAHIKVLLELVVQAAQVSSSLNTFPNLITKSSNHQAHGLHLVALLRSST
jgi:hypothetical protein